MLDGGGWSMPGPGCFTPGRDPVPIIQEAGWAPGLVWTGAKNLAPPGFNHWTIQLYQLCYPGPPLVGNHTE